MKAAIVGISLLAGFAAIAQTNQPPPEDFKPSTLNQFHPLVPALSSLGVEIEVQVNPPRSS